MIALLARLAPGSVLIVGLILGALPAGAAGWWAREAKFAWFERGGIEQAAAARADDACTIRVQAAADSAEAAERARQKAAGDEALRIYREALARSALQAELASREHEKEISDYEAQLAEQGRLCPLTQSDLDFLYSGRPTGAEGRG